MIRRHLKGEGFLNRFSGKFQGVFCVGKIPVEQIRKLIEDSGL